MFACHFLINWLAAKMAPSFSAILMIVAALSHHYHGVEGDRVPRGHSVVGNCSSVEFLLPLRCDVSYGQAFADLYTGCGMVDLAQAFVDGCRTNSSGNTCEFVSRSVFSYYLDVKYGGECPTELSSCPNSACNDSLDALISATGCCFTTLDVNWPDPARLTYTVSAVSGSSRYTGGLEDPPVTPLPELCGVATPSVCPTQSSLTLNPVSGVVEQCSEEELVYRYFTDVLCRYEAQKPLLDVYESCQADNFRDALVEACSVNSDGQICELIRSNVTDRLSDIMDKCEDYNDTYCLDACSEILESYQSDFGCCINALLNDTDSPPLDVLSYDLWSVCGVETVGECESTLQEPPPTEPATEPTMTTSGGPVEAVAATELLIIMTLLALQLLY